MTSSDSSSRQSVESPAPTHELKTWPEYFDAQESGVKSFEFRKDDREPRYEVGDTLRLREWRWSQSAHPGEYSGRELTRRVTYVARGGVIPDGYCCMGVEPISAPAPTAGGETAEAQVDALIEKYKRACEMVVIRGDSLLHETVPVRDKARDALRASLLARQRDGEPTKP